MIGATFGHYRITSKLGAGGMGEVFLAQDTRLDRQVALKLLRDELQADPVRRKRFLVEARAASAFGHPNVCTVFEVGEDAEGRLFIALEYFEGRTLDVVLSEASLDLVRAVDIARQVAEALSAAHAKGIMHRDIKPSNISVNARGHVKVLDFGLAKRLDDAQSRLGGSALTASGDILGTPLYMSPEQARGRAVDHRTDIFSLGAVIYESLTGRPPFEGGTFGELVDKIVNESPAAIARLNYDVPPELEHITLKCLQKVPDRRYQSADELRIDLENVMAALATEPKRLPQRSAARGESPEPSQLTDSIVPGAETVDVPAPQAAPDPRELESCDVLINCASVDDQPAMPGKPGWISQLRRNLGLRIEQLSGEPVKVAAWPAPVGRSTVDQCVLESLTNVKAMVSVVSPPFVKSEICRRGFESFWQKAEGDGRLWVDDKSRIVKAVKTPVSQSDVPPGFLALLSRLAEFEFYEEDPETGRLREFDEALGPTAQQRFLERVYDLAHDLCQVIRARALPQRRNGDAKTVFLAESTSDIRPHRERVRRELTERGHQVLPAAPLPTVAEELEETVRDLLRSADVAIHLVGSRYGLVPENGTESFTEVQMRLATEAANASSLRRLIWIPPDVDATDERQAVFLRRLRDTADFLRGAEIIEGAINELKDVLVSGLERPARRQVAAAPQRAAPLVYLLADIADEQAIEPLEDFLFESGLEVRTPDFEGEEAEAVAAHLETLGECDAVVIYYGAVRRSWVEAQLRNLAKAFGHGRSRPFLAQAVWLAPPLDRRKERFRTHAAEILAQPTDDFAATPELTGLVRRIRDGAATGGRV